VSSPQDSASRSSDWVRGLIDWNNVQVPWSSVEVLCGVESTKPRGRARIAIFNGLSEVLNGRVFGMLTEGFPQLVRVNREVMELHDEKDWPDDGPIICQIRMINEYPLIPDLEAIEMIVQEQVA